MKRKYRKGMNLVEQARENFKNKMPTWSNQGPLADRIEELEGLLDDKSAGTIHSCGPDCQRPMCVLRKENERLRKGLELAQIKAATASNQADRTCHEINTTLKEKP